MPYFWHHSNKFANVGHLYHWFLMKSNLSQMIPQAQLKQVAVTRNQRHRKQADPEDFKNWRYSMAQNGIQFQSFKSWNRNRQILQKGEILQH